MKSGLPRQDNCQRQARAEHMVRDVTLQLRGLEHWLLLQRTQIWFPEPHRDPQSPVTPVPVDLAHSSGFLNDPECMWCPSVHAGKALVYIK